MLGNDVIGHQYGSSALFRVWIKLPGFGVRRGKGLGINSLRERPCRRGLRSESPGPRRFMRHTAASLMLIEPTPIEPS
jgi:hypothetical protein